MKANFEVIIRYPSGGIESIYTHVMEWQAKLECEVARERGMLVELRDLRLTSPTGQRP